MHREPSDLSEPSPAHGRSSPAERPTAARKSAALKFVLMIGVLSFFADFTYEGARSVYGPFLALLSASAAVVGIVAGLGELAGYGLRLVSGRWADRTGSFWPIAIFGFWPALVGAAVWGVGMGAHESIIPATVAPMVSPDRRASAYGLFTAGYGLSWFLGSAVMGVLYEYSIAATIAFCTALQLAAVPIFFALRRQHRSYEGK